MKTMFDTLFSFAAILHVTFRGNSSVYTTVTDNKLRHNHRTERPGGGARSYVLVCHQLRHRVVYERWYMPNRTHYSYTVEVVSVDGERQRDYNIGHYPHLCAKWLHRTIYPHTCAINAHMDYLRKIYGP